MFKLECLGAKHGDCLLIHYGDAGAPKLVLIDGGPGRVYKNFLKPRLEQLRAQADGDLPLEIELGMVSHIDADHIKGMIDLTDDLVDEDNADNRLVEFTRFWHNSFEDITGAPGSATVSAASNAIIAARAPGASLPFGVLNGSDGRAGEILASVNQGRTLRDNLVRLGLDGNLPYGGLVQLGGQPDPFELPGGLKFTLVGPLAVRVEKLQKKWSQTASPAQVAAFTDNSVANLASIVLLAECDGKKILLTGDARGDDILDGLEAQNLIQPDGTLKLDIHKVCHHGSDRNVTTEFFRRLPANTYVISGDGHHDNPEPECMRMIRKSRNDQGGYRIVIASPITRMDAHKKTAFDAEIKKLRDAGVTIDFRPEGDLSITVDLA